MNCNRAAIGRWERFIISDSNQNRSNDITKEEIATAFIPYPNPVSINGEALSIKINLSNIENNAVVQLTDLNGKVIAKKDLNVLSPGNNTIDLSDMQKKATPGLYILSFRSKSQSVSTKVSFQ